MPPLSISEVRDALAVVGVLASLLAGGVAAYCGITHRLDAIAKDLQLLAGQTSARLDREDARLTRLETRVQDLLGRLPRPSRRDIASD